MNYSEFSTKRHLSSLAAKHLHSLSPVFPINNSLPPQSLAEAKKPASSWTARVDPPPETRRPTTHPTKRRKKDPGHGSWQCPIRAASDSGRGSACIACHFDQPHRQGRVSNPTVSVRPLTFFFFFLRPPLSAHFLTALSALAPSLSPAPTPAGRGGRMPTRSPSGHVGAGSGVGSGHGRRKAA